MFALLRALDRKLVRDLWGMRMQALAIAFVIAGGVAVHLLAAGMLTSLEETRRAYYDRYLFADVWAPVVRAPNALIAGVRAIDGVQAAESRIRFPALLDMPDMAEPASGEIISLPESGEGAVNRLHLTQGRMPRPDHRDEAVVLQGFADAHGLAPGDSLAVTVYGGRLRLHVVGIALSPEHVYAIAPGQMVPDARLYGVIWMNRRALAQATNRDGAFNEVVVRLSRGANEAAVIAGLDRLLAPYGAPGAYGRRDQLSDSFVASEMDQLRTMGMVIPPIFLLVAAFLVNIVITRIIAVQRAGIGLMKAFGYSDGEVTRHYLKLVAAIGALGLAIGGGLGMWLGRVMAELYMEYFTFPFLVFRADAMDYVAVCAVSGAAVLGGAALAARRAAALNPAQAMTLPPPPDYSRAAGMGITRLRALDQQTRMILRQIIRWPARAGLTMAGIAASVALLIGTLFMMDSIKVLIGDFFGVANRHDVAVTFVEPRPRSAYHSIARLPGVMAAEPFRAAPARLRHGHLEERAAIIGVPADAELSRLIDAAGRAVTPPPGGLVLSDDLAAKLNIRAGDTIQIEITEGRRPALMVPVAAVAPTHVGSGAQMRIEDLNRLLREGPVVSGVNLRVDRDAVDALYARLTAAPGVAGVSLQALAADTLAGMMDENLGAALGIYSLFGALIALGVVYNSIRISYAERQRELASLRVLGFSRGAVSYILLGEVAFLTLLALPLGMAGGTGLAWYMAGAMSSDMFRLPFVIEPSTYGFACAVVLAVTVGSSLLVRRQLDRLDMVSALKTGE
ncbi:MAG: FtsX-like permease family protein [Maricaulaceae bacterium]|nr:FtsX-like permease family protein [Maricaulaceae bacterium]